VIFSFLTVANFAIVFGWFVLKRRGSLVPLVGGLAGVGACLTKDLRGARDDACDKARR
jgi:hypothetical protein